MVSLESSFLLLCCLVLIAKGSHSSLVWLNCQLLSDIQKSHLRVPTVFLHEADCQFWFPGGTPAQTSCQLPTTQLWSRSLCPWSANHLSTKLRVFSCWTRTMWMVTVRQPECVPLGMATPYKMQSSLRLDVCFHQLLAGRLSELTSVIVGMVLPGILLQNQPTAKKAVVKQGGLGSKQFSVVLTQPRLL